MLSFVDSSVDLRSQINYFKMKITGAANGTYKLSFIVADNKIIGCIDLHNIDSTTGKAEIGYWIHSSYSGQNIVSKAVKRLCTYSFEVLELIKLSSYKNRVQISGN